MLLTIVSSYLTMHWFLQNPHLGKEQIRYKGFPEAAIWYAYLLVKFEIPSLNGSYLEPFPDYL